MKGLELSRSFFQEECLPMIQQKMPEVLPYLAAGLVGEGSECFGFDDEKSRDHDWGPAFCLWLPDDAARQYGSALLGLVDYLPKKYKGFPVKRADQARTGVFFIRHFYRTLTGLEAGPKSAEEWLSVPEPKLAAAVNGEVFLDNYGEFTRIREALLAHYPKDLLLRQVAQTMALASQTGQYNYPRSLNRDDSLASDMMRSYFVSYAADLVFLLNRKYRPFYKWKYRALKKLPLLGEESYQRLSAILKETDPWQAAYRIEDQSAAMLDLCRSQGLTDGDSAFMLDHLGIILSRIRDPQIRSVPISMVL